MNKCETADAQFKKGEQQLSKSNQNEALQSFSLCLQIDPYYYQSQIKMGDIYHIQEKYNEALGSIERAIHINPNETQAQFKRGLVLQDLNRKREALEAYNCCIDLDDSQSIVHFKKAVVLQDQWKYNEAIESQNTAIKLNDEQIEAIFNKGICQFHLKKQKDSIIEIEKLLKLDYYLVANIISKVQYLKAKVIYTLNKYKSKGNVLLSTQNDNLSECSVFSDAIKTDRKFEMIDAYDYIVKSLEIDPTDKKAQELQVLIDLSMNDDKISVKEQNYTTLSKKNRLWKTMAKL